jgi:hypothetical protein
MKKTYLLVLFFFSLALLAIINHRTPFCQQDGGPWSLGYGKSQRYPVKIEPDKNVKYTIERLKAQNDSTVFLADPFLSVF